MDIYSILLVGDAACKTALISEWISEDNRLLLNHIIKKIGTSPEKILKIFVKESDITGEKLCYDETSCEITISLLWVPLHMQLICWIEDDMSIETRTDLDDYKKLVFVNSWQYQNGVMESMIKKAIKKYQQNMFLDLLLVLHKSHIRTAYTDMDNPDDSLEQAYEKYKNMLPVKKYTGASSAEFIFRSDVRFIPYIGQGYEASVESWLVGIEDESSGVMLEYQWDVQEKIDSEILNNPSDMDKKVTSYKIIQNEKNIMDAFFINFKKNLYPEALKLIKQFYEFQMNRVVIWDIKKDCEIIENTLEKMYNAIRKNYPKVIACPSDELAYTHLAEQTHIKTDFIKMIKDFYQNDVQDFIYSHMRKQADRIKGLLKME